MNDETNEETEEQPVADYVAELVDQEPATEAAEAIPAGETATNQVVYNPTVVPPPPQDILPPPSLVENLAAKGGAVGAIVLGVLSFVGSFITSYAILNSLMGILLGLWGLRSNHRRMALIGILLCIVSAFFCAVEISAWVQTLWPQDDF